MPRGFKRRRNTTFGRRTRFKRRRFVRAKRRVDRIQNRRIRSLYKLTRPEFKYRDQFQSTTVGLSWQTLLPRPITYIPQGDTNSTRIGNKCKVHSIRIKGTITVDDPTNLCRMLLVRFGRTDASTIAVNDFLTDGGAAAPQHLYSGYTRNGNQKYAILYDKMITLTGAPNTVPGVTTTSIKKFDFTIKPKGKMKDTFYALDTDTTPSDGYIYLIASTDSALSGPNFTVHSRVIFSG